MCFLTICKLLKLEIMPRVCLVNKDCPVLIRDKGDHKAILKPGILLENKLKGIDTPGINILAYMQLSKTITVHIVYTAFKIIICQAPTGGKNWL